MISLVAILLGLAQDPADNARRATDAFARSRVKAQAAPGVSPGTPADFKPSPPTEPTRIALDFKAQSADQVARAIDARSGGMVVPMVQGVPTKGPGRITLESTAPVPFWEALDRLSAAEGLVRDVSRNDFVGSPSRRVQLIASPGQSTVDYGPAAYVGGFRLGAVVVHERSVRSFEAAKAPNAFFDDATPPFHAEIPILAEPDLLYIRTGPMKGLEAVDDAGRSLLDPAAGGKEAGFGRIRSDYLEPRALIVAMVRPAGPSKALASLRGLVPLEVARRPRTPTSEITLEGSTGKTFVDGDIAIKVGEFGRSASGVTTIRLSARLEGKRGEFSPETLTRQQVRLWSIANRQLELVDASGKFVMVNGGGGPDSTGGIRLDYHYTHSSPTPGLAGSPPSRLRVYRPDWVDWDLPFAFKDLPLP